MNRLRRGFCRTYQAAFRMAMPVLPYREPERFGSVAELEKVFRRMGTKSVLLVTDPFIRKAGLTKSFEELCARLGIKCPVYDGTRANPTVQNVEEARWIYLKEKCSCLAAIGGGSAIDCAKAIGARVVYPKRTLQQMKGTLRLFRKIPPLIAIPTTAGTGSEITPTAVLTDEGAKHKYTMNDFVLIPAFAVHDPEMTRTLPPSLTATTGMDALTHAVEAYIGQSTTKETRRLAIDAVRLIFGNVEQAYCDGNDMTARRNMLMASYYAGHAFSKSYVGYVHAVAHSLGGQYNIPHGLANSVLLPHVLEAYGPAIHGKLRELAVAVGIADGKESEGIAANRFIMTIRGLNARMGIPETLKGIRMEDIPIMAAHANREGNPLYPVPVLMDAGELEKLYETVMDGGEEK